MKKLISILMTLILMGSIVSCSKDDSITIASKPMTEQFIIAEMMFALIEQETDLTVEYKAGIGGGTANIHPAMMKGEIDIYPEYSGTGWMEVLKQDLINDPEELYDAVKKGYSEEFNIYWSNLYGFNDTFGLAMKKDLANELNIKTYSDLAAVSKDLTFGAEHDFFEREDGLPGLNEVYGMDFGKEVGMDIGLKYQAINSGEVDVINIFSTDGKLEEYNMLVLVDDLNFFPSYYAATLVRQEVLDENPELIEVLGMLDGAINNDEMTLMNYKVEIEKQEPREVAREFLQEKGILN
ncbi:MAG: glycine betaine ABC transporter substrate-binding protein [Sphaerochaeta sp.]